MFMRTISDFHQSTRPLRIRVSGLSPLLFNDYYSRLRAALNRLTFDEAERSTERGKVSDWQDL